MMGFCMSTFFKRIDSVAFFPAYALPPHSSQLCVFIYALDDSCACIGDEKCLPDDLHQDEYQYHHVLVRNDVQAGVPPCISPTDLSTYMDKAKGIMTSSPIKTMWHGCLYLLQAYAETTAQQGLRNAIQMIELCGDWQTDENSTNCSSLSKGTRTTR